MLGFKNFLFKGDSAELSAESRLALEAWRNLAQPALDEVHFHMRYVVVDVASSGFNAQADQLTGIAASCVLHGVQQPADSIYVDLEDGSGEASTVNAKLIAFLKYTAKAPLVTYHVPYVAGFLQRAYKEHLGLNFQPQWIDLASLLPSLFGETGDGVMPLDQWIERFGLYAVEGRRSAMDNTLVLARMFQMILVRGKRKEINTAADLLEESQASGFLRRAY